MRTRQHIKNDIIAKRNTIEQLESEIKELILEDIQLNDDKQWYTEQNEVHEVSRRPKKSETFLVGRIHWNEKFNDESRPNEPIIIERSRTVRINGEWKW